MKRLNEYTEEAGDCEMLICCGNGLAGETWPNDNLIFNWLDADD